MSTRWVGDLLQALGLTGIDESRSSRNGKELEGTVETSRNRPLEVTYHFFKLEALYLQVRHNQWIVSQAVTIASCIRESGDGELRGLALGASEE